MKNDTGLKFQLLQLSEQEKKLQGGRQEQEFVFVSKKDMEERRKKREEAANSKPTTLWFTCDYFVFIFFTWILVLFL